MNTSDRMVSVVAGPRSGVFNTSDRMVSVVTGPRSGVFNVMSLKAFLNARNLTTEI